MELDWSLPKNKQSPLSLVYSPEPSNLSQNFVNPFLGYPTCPIIGRYNRGQYRIGQTLFHLEFKCKYNHQRSRYECGDRPIKIPEHMLNNVRNIPEVIVNNKAAGIKNSPEVLPEKYLVRDQLSVIWIVSFGELGRDFLNYLNHMYVLAPYLFAEEKLRREIHFLPIYAHLPQCSGLNDFQVERGLNFNNYRGQYMSFHLSKGAPAFSPNNMRLSVLGGKIIISKQPQKQEKKEKPKKKYMSRQQYEETKLKEKAEKSEVKEGGHLNLQVVEKKEEKPSQGIEVQRDQKEKNKVEEKMDVEVPQPKQNEQKKKKQGLQAWQQLQNPLPVNLPVEPELEVKEQRQIPRQKKQKGNKDNKNKGNHQIPKEQKIEHQGFIHFYTSVLLQNDYKLYYHWHIQDRLKEDLIKEIWSQSTCIQEFLQKYTNFSGNDALSIQSKGIFFPSEG